MYFPSFLIVSNINSLTSELKKLLVRKECDVTLIENVQELDGKLSGKIFDYIIYFDPDGEELEKDLTITKKLNLSTNTKTLFVFPYTLNEKSFFNTSPKAKEVLYNSKNFEGIIFLGDVIGASPLHRETSYFTEFILSYLRDEKPHAYFNKHPVFYPISSQEAAKQIVRSLFSLKVYGKKTAILGKPVAARELIRFLKRIHAPKEILFDDNKLVNQEADERIIVKENKRELIRSVLGLLEKDALLLIRTQEEKKSKFTLNKALIFRRWKLKFLVLLSSVLLLPFFLLALSISSLFIAYKSFQWGYLPLTNRALNFSSASSKLSGKYTSIFINSPYIKYPFLRVERSARIIEKEAQIGEEFLGISNNLITFTEKLTNNEPYDLSSYNKNFSLELNSLYKELAFLESEIKEADKLTQKISTIVFDSQNLKIFREKILLGSKIFSNLDPILGKEKPARFALVIQDNRFLRATGGRIESLVLVTISNGKITDLNVVSAKFADKNLVGTVDPPSPLKKYFGSKTWYLRDANWDPDFTTTSSQIEWFIDKELDEKVDGVIALDYVVLSQLLDISKSTQKENFNKAIKDLPTDGEYPGELESSVTNFLTNFVNNTESLNTASRFKLNKFLLERLERKNIQISLKNYQIMELLAELGWDGGLVNKECSNNCYSDTVSLIESTKEGNSTEVSREYKFVASLEEGLIKRKLFVFLENNSNNVYSFYMRVLSPSESGFSPVEIVTNESEMSKSLEVRGVRSFKEAGIFEEILAKKTKALLFSWESATKLSYKEGGEYKLLVRKQAGMEGYPLEVEIMFPENLTFTSTPPLALTNGSNFVYNTELSRDFVSRIFWKEK